MLIPSPDYRANFADIDFTGTKEWRPKPREQGKRSNLTAPHVISDCMDGVKSMLDGKMYDSKSALRKTYRAAGMIELGNDAPLEPKKPDRPKMKDIEAAVERAAARTGL